VRHRSSRLVGRFAGHRQNQRDLVGGERAAAPRPRQVAQHLFDGLTQGRRLFGAFDDRQLLEIVLPTSPPDTDALAFASSCFAMSSFLCPSKASRMISARWPNLSRKIAKRPSFEERVVTLLMTTLAAIPGMGSSR